MHKNTVRRSRANASLVAIALLGGSLAGCENMSETDKGTAKGAGVGAIGGAAIGGIAGGRSGAATGAAIGAIGGAIAGNLWSKRMEDKKRAMEQSTQGTGVDVTRTADNQLKVNVPNDISFDTGRSNIKPDLRGVLDNFANGLQNDQSVVVRVVGHTDSTGSDTINDPLSVDRAQSVRDYLAGRGVPATRIETSGRGGSRAVAAAQRRGLRPSDPAGRTATRAPERARGRPCNPAVPGPARRAGVPEPAPAGKGGAVPQ